MADPTSIGVIPNTKTVEVVPVSPLPVRVDWTDIAIDGVKDGAWAVLLFGAITFTAMRGVVGKYLDKHIGLLDVMKDSLNKNSASLESLSKAELLQNDSLIKQGEILERQGNALSGQQLVLTSMDERHKDDIKRSFDLNKENHAVIVNLADANKNQSLEHVTVLQNLAEIKLLGASYQLEIISKLKDIEALCKDNPVPVDLKPTSKNFWGR